MLLDSEPERDEWSEPHDEDEVDSTPVQPGGSRIEIRRFDDGVSIEVPPAGLWRGSGGLFGFSLLCNGFLTLLTTAVLRSVFGGNPQDQVSWTVVPFLAIFWSVGIGILLGSIQMGRRHAGLAVAGGTLMVLQTGLFGKKQREWPLADILAIRAGPTGMTVNHQPVLELQIYDTHGGKLGLLAGRAEEELRWLAHELRLAARAPEWED